MTNCERTGTYALFWDPAQPDKAAWPSKCQTENIGVNYHF